MQIAQLVPAAAHHDPGRVVWDRIWAYEPSDERDDCLLSRERSSRRWELIVDRLSVAFGGLRGLRTIELGSGRGDLSVLLAERGMDVTLLDQSAAALEQARHRFSRLGLTVSREQADMFQLPDRFHRAFDVVVSSGVIEHFRHDQRTEAIRAHFNAIRPGGLAVISVPNAWCLPYRLWKACLELRGRWPYGVEIPYTRAELDRRARAAGFYAVETFGVEFRRSVEQLRRSVSGSPMSARADRSPFDSWMGLALLQFARRGERNFA